MNLPEISSSKPAQKLIEDKEASFRRDIEVFGTLGVSSPTAEQANMTFFAHPPVAEPSLHSTSYNWKSTGVRRAEEFARIKRLVKHIAPEQFQNPARPTNGQCQIMPTSVLKYVEHKRDVLAMAMKQAEQNLASRRENERVMNIKTVGEVQQPIQSRFGEGGIVFGDGLSPVLCQPTMWSAEHEQCQIESSQWPSLSELQDCGDMRENDQIATRCGRYLPLPHRKTRLPQYSCVDADCHDSAGPPRHKRFLPLDEPGPIFVNGPWPIDVIRSNFETDVDDTFEARGNILLGRDLMREIGEKRSRFVPAWLARRRQQEDYERRLGPSIPMGHCLLPYGWQEIP